MTQQQALKEAQRRWGNGSVAVIPLIACVVMRAGETMGTGITWEDAFAYADRREKERTT